MGLSAFKQMPSGQIWLLPFLFLATWSSAHAFAVPSPKFQKYDVVVVGGSSAGLSAALSLGRSCRSVLVIDSGSPCNRFQEKSQNFLGSDGKEVAMIRKEALSDVSFYPTVVLLNDSTVTGMEFNNSSNPISVKITKKDQSEVDTVFGRKLVIATGVKDVLPNDLPGAQECWGKTLIHCPYCHGYEFANCQTALLGMSPPMVLQMAPILRKFASELFVIGEYRQSNGDDTNSFSKEQLSRFKENGITLINKQPSALLHHNGILEAIVLGDDGDETIRMDVAYLRPPFEHRFPFDKLTSSLELTEKGYIRVDHETQKTSIPNTYACGDCTDPNRSLSIAIASGTRAAKMLNFELSIEDWTNP